jgi:hypothetical protein
MRSAGLENSVTSFSLSTHQANNEQYQRRADEAENFVDESQAPEAPPPEEGRSEQVPPQETNPQQEVDSPQAEAPPQSEEESDTQQEESQSRDIGGNLDVKA